MAYTYTDRLKKRLASQPKWTPFVRAPHADEPAPRCTDGVRRGGSKAFCNSRWQVWLTEEEPTGFPDPKGEGDCLYVSHLSIKRHDRDVILGKDWRDFQRIKNELCGEERDAIEIYPAESKLVDTANQYHLWVFPAGLQFPVGWQTRLVGEDMGDSGAVQRKWDDRDLPNDAKSADEMVKLLGDYNNDD